MSRCYWIVESYTSSRLLFADGTTGISESGGRIYSRHLTEDAADKAANKIRRLSPLAQVRVVRR